MGVGSAFTITMLESQSVGGEKKLYFPGGFHK